MSENSEKGKTFPHQGDKMSPWRRRLGTGLNKEYSFQQCRVEEKTFLGKGKDMIQNHRGEKQKHI